MRYIALACDYDGTLATDGVVAGAVIAALERVRDSGRKLILVTGRELGDLERVFPRLDLFAWVVAENGALLYEPATHTEQPLYDPPVEEFVTALRRRGVEPLSVGRVIVATWHPHEITVLDVIRDLGLELQVIFNKGAVMVLPSGLNKGAGLHAALRALGLSPHNVVGVGDAENDHAFLSVCECAVAVANALPMLKERADVVTQGDHGAGVIELIEALVGSDLSAFEPRLRRHDLLLGYRDDGKEVFVQPQDVRVLLAGPSGSGKSTLATALLERLTAQRYQFCLIDPEGDYEGLNGAVTVGDPERTPNMDEVIQLLKDPEQNAVVNLLGLKLEDRPSFFADMLPRLQELRAQTGRPHWVIADEAHHLLPATWQVAASIVPRDVGGLLLITVHPGDVAPVVLSDIDVVIAVGEAPERTLHDFSQALGERPSQPAPVALEPDEALIWHRRQEREPVKMRLEPPRGEHRRHIRKYAQGDLAPELSFYFRGPQGKLNLRAQNLVLFSQLADGVDDATWLYHLHQGDYARWFREVIHDDDLAAEADDVAGTAGISADESRSRIKAAIERRYIV